jgi:hypothetical protein
MGCDFTNFDAGCHGPVPLETTICPENALTHSMISAVHHVARDHKSSVRVLSGHDPQRLRGVPVSQF